MASGHLDARQFWQSHTEKSLQRVQAGCAEWNALAAYFGKHMPPDSQLQIIERVEKVTRNSHHDYIKFSKLSLYIHLSELMNYVYPRVQAYHHHIAIELILTIITVQSIQ